MYSCSNLTDELQHTHLVALIRRCRRVALQEQLTPQRSSMPGQQRLRRLHRRLSQERPRRRLQAKAEASSRQKDPPSCLQHLSQQQLLQCPSLEQAAAASMLHSSLLCQ